jgi:hypothetical protein
MKKIFVTSAFISIIFLNCTFKQKIEREIKPKEKYNIQTNEDGQASYKDNIAEITVETFNEKHWEKLTGYNCFKNRKSESSSWRSPKLLFHHMVIKNISYSPVKIANIKLQYGQIEKSQLSSDDIKKRCKSPVYSLIDFNSLLKNRRLLDDSICLDDIDFDNNSIEYKLNFINSGDLISKIFVFEWIPVEYRTYKITIQLESPGDVKIIDFEFKRFEYRKNGPFSKPENENIDYEL